MGKLVSRTGWGVMLMLLALLVGGPTTHASETGGIVVCYELPIPAEDDPSKNDVDLHIERLTPDGKKSWGRKSGGAPLASSRLVESLPAVCSDGAGGAIAVYVADFTKDEGPAHTRLYAQRIGPDGKRLWLKENRAPIVSSLKGVSTNPAVLSDEDGGAIVAYLWKAKPDHSSVLVQKIDADGNCLWEPNKGGLLLAGTPGFEGRPLIVTDGQGGAIVLFEIVIRESDRGIWAQRVSTDGKLLWLEGKSPTQISNSRSLERRASAIADGKGGVIAAFEVEFVGGKHVGDVNIGAQRLSADGTSLWGNGAHHIIVSARVGREGRPYVVSDGAGGALVAFEFEWTTGDYSGDIDVRAQRLSPEGKVLWPNPPPSVAVSPPLERAPVAVATDDGGMIVVYEHEPRAGPNAGNCGIVAQRMSADGVRMWNEGKRSAPVFFKEYPEHSPIALPDGQGGVIVVASANAPPTGEVEGVVVLLAQRLNGAGTLTWRDGAGPATVGAAIGPDLHPRVARLFGP